MQGVLEGTILTFFGYIGFESTTNLIDEALNPGQNVPKSLYYVVGIACLINTFAGLGLTGMGIASTSRHHDPDIALAITFQQNGLKWMEKIIYITAMFGITACAISCTLVQTKINKSLSKDGLFYPVFGIMDRATMVPKIGAWIISIPIALIAFCMDLTQISKLSSICSMQTYILIGMMFLQYRLRGANLSSQKKQMNSP